MLPGVNTPSSWQAKFLGQEIAKHQPKTFLELGCYVGYSAVTIASQLPAGGKLVSVDISPENVKVAEQVVAHAGLGDRVEFVVGVLGNVTKVGHGPVLLCCRMVAGATKHRNDPALVTVASECCPPDSNCDTAVNHCATLVSSPVCSCEEGRG
jgi:SAM-dependent methyltransferase